MFHLGARHLTRLPADTGGDVDEVYATSSGGLALKRGVKPLVAERRMMSCD